MRFCLLVASRAFCVNVSIWDVSSDICSSREVCTVLRWAMAVSEVVMGTNLFEDRNLIVYVKWGLQWLSTVGEQAISSLSLERYLSKIN